MLLRVPENRAAINTPILQIRTPRLRAGPAKRTEKGLTRNTEHSRFKIQLGPEADL